MDLQFEHVADYLLKQAPDITVQLLDALNKTRQCYQTLEIRLKESLGGSIQSLVNDGLYEEAFAELTRCNELDEMISVIDKQIEYLSTAQNLSKTDSENDNTDAARTAVEQKMSAAIDESENTSDGPVQEGYQIISFPGVIEEITKSDIERCYIQVSKSVNFPAWLDKSNQIIYVAQHLYNRHHGLLSKDSILIQKEYNSLGILVKIWHK